MTQDRGKKINNYNNNKNCEQLVIIKSDLILFLFFNRQYVVWWCYDMILFERDTSLDTTTTTIIYSIRTSKLTVVVGTVNKL